MNQQRGKQGAMGEHGERGKPGKPGDTGERGPTGETGRHGVGGERGPTGDHGQAGDMGPKGEVGERGEIGRTGRPGEAYSSFLTRHVITAYLVLCLGVVGAIAASWYALQESTDRVNDKTRELCESGNVRSDLQRTVFLESRERTEAFDFRAIINAPEPERSQVATDLKAQSLAAIDRNIASVPYVDCDSGKRISLTTTTTGGH